ncbi:unnamed protein product [Ilex paraguariensis]|uniref:Inhibitor I9 domain-containing protein n=1 Tax=Ilex paraguariensis TaxID=185542 RepID=A0ABC8QSX5_9AQUA
MGLVEGVPLLLLFAWFLSALHVGSISAERSTYIVHMDKTFMPKALASPDYCAMVSQDELESVKKSPGFLSAYRDRHVTIDTTHTTEFLSLNTATGLWPASDYGKDVIVGVIDTGVWPESPSFRDDGMTEVKGTFKVGQEFNSSLCNLKLIGA